MTILGIGEAGTALARDLLAAGAEVRAWDPDPERHLDGAAAARSAGEAAVGSDVVLSVNAAAVALGAARDTVPALAPGRLFADLNSASPRLKAQVAAVVETAGARFADVALLAPVPAHGLRTPALVSGGGAAAFAGLFRPLGMPVEVVEGGPGAAATRKLVRSVFMKGLAAAAIESMVAAERVGCGEWLRAEIARVLDGPGEPLLTRLLEGSRRHAVRRIDEMQAASLLLSELGVEPRVARSAVGWLEELAGERTR
ncbi:MAG TPA: DUF1932 domain-containing protein [Gaiellaceae bacterium]|nr:DUF1932 domain-containing protein [Gaiellaceae bacterium]